MGNDLGVGKCSNLVYTKPLHKNPAKAGFFMAEAASMQNALDHIFQWLDEVGVAPDFLARSPADQPQHEEKDEIRLHDGQPDGETDCPRPGIVGIKTRDDDANGEEHKDKDGVHENSG